MPITECTDTDDFLPASLRSWFKSAVGQELLEAEQRIVDRLIPKLYGAFLVQVGLEPERDMASQSPIPYQYMIYPRLQLGLPRQSIVAEADELPLEHNSVDVILLHHTLDFATNPHQVLREAARVLRPGGHLLIVAFNPLSWWGVKRFCTRRPKRRLWQEARFLSHKRLSDWIKLLELTELRTLSDYYLPPYENTRWRQRFGRLQPLGRKSLPMCGAFNVILARKDIGGMTPIQQKRVSRRFLQLPVTEPAATRGQMRDGR